MSHVILLKLQPGKRYLPLLDGQIRLIRLLPGRATDPLEIKILTAYLSDVEEQYSAVSYTWGDLEPRHEIRCKNAPTAVMHQRTEDGQYLESEEVEERVMEVSPNLHDCLKALRDGEFEMWLWIDQLCIDQTDPDERKSQVALMARIYAGASYVSIWLSREVWESTLAYENLLQFHGLVCVYNVMAGGHDDRATAEAQVTPATWESLRLVFSQRYFRRLWIVQEIVKSQFAFVMISGERVGFHVLSIINAYLQNMHVHDEHFDRDFRAYTRPLEKIGTIYARLNNGEMNNK